MGMVYPLLDAAPSPDAGAEASALALVLTVFFDGVSRRSADEEGGDSGV